MAEADALLEQRVNALEREVEGEKLVTRHIFEQTRRNGEGIAALRTDFKALRAEFGSLRGEFDTLRGEFNTLRGEFNMLRGEFNTLRGEFVALRQELPTIVADTLREVLRERDR